MKYVIWGAGKRGKKALEIFGEGKILSFIDQNENIVGKKVGNIVVNSIDYIERSKEGFIVLITPVGYEEEIANILGKKGIFNYLFFSDHPIGIDLDSKTDIREMNFDKLASNRKIMLYEITWFNLFLYDSFSKLGSKVTIYSIDDKKKSLYNLLLNEGYNIINRLDMMSENDCIISEIGTIPFFKGRFIELNDYIEKSYPVYNKRIELYKNVHKNKRCFIIPDIIDASSSDEDI